MNSLNIKSSFARYATGTFGLILVAIGVALSIKSDLGTAPISCPPYVVSLAGHFQIGSFTIGTVGQYTMLMHLIFIVLQILFIVSLEKVNTCCYRKGATKGGRTTYKILTNNIVHI